MGYYWEPTGHRRSKSNGTRIIAVLIILMIVVSAGIVYLIASTSGGTGTCSYQWQRRTPGGSWGVVGSILARYV